MNETEVRLLHVELRELAYRDPVETKNRFLQLLANDEPKMLSVLAIATDPEDSRLRQIIARSLVSRQPGDHLRSVLGNWSLIEDDEFAAVAIRDALSTSVPKQTKKRSKDKRLADMSELVGTYKYLTSRLRHRLLNSLPEPGMMIKSLRFEIQQSAPPQLAADLLNQLDDLFASLSRLKGAVDFEEDEAFFLPAVVSVPVWLADYRIRFEHERGLINLVVDVDGSSDQFKTMATEYWLETVFRNLWKNSLDAMGDARGAITCFVRSDSQAVTVLIVDDGPGFVAEDHAWAFRYQHSTKDLERGRGSMEVTDAMQRMGGSVALRSTDYGHRVMLSFKRVVE